MKPIITAIALLLLIAGASAASNSAKAAQGYRGWQSTGGGGTIWQGRRMLGADNAEGHRIWQYGSGSHWHGSYGRHGGRHWHGRKLAGAEAADSTDNRIWQNSGGRSWQNYGGGGQIWRGGYW